jgi:L-seryl-tRNA(Ser) seleniumtransferase
MDSSLTHRRTFMKWVAAAPVFGVIAAHSTAEKLAAAMGKSSSAEVYRRLGVRPLINRRGTWTYQRFAGVAGGSQSHGVRGRYTSWTC